MPVLGQLEAITAEGTDAPARGTPRRVATILQSRDRGLGHSNPPTDGILCDAAGCRELRSGHYGRDAKRLLTTLSRRSVLPQVDVRFTESGL